MWFIFTWWLRCGWFSPVWPTCDWFSPVWPTCDWFSPRDTGVIDFHLCDPRVIDFHPVKQVWFSPGDTVVTDFYLVTEVWLIFTWSLRCGCCWSLFESHLTEVVHQKFPIYNQPSPDFWVGQCRALKAILLRVRYIYFNLFVVKSTYL